jgi:hypothetical protein
VGSTSLATPAPVIERDWQAVWDVRSERWQESTAGQSVAATLQRGDVQIEFPDIEIPD